MLRNEAISVVQRGLGFRTDKSDDIASAMQQTQRLLEQGKTLPWFLLQEEATLVLAADAQSVALPTGFIREHDDSGLRFQPEFNVGWTWLSKGWYEDVRMAHGYTDAGTPTHYVLRSSSIYFNRPASEEITFYWDYYKKGDLLTSDVENVWLLHAPDVLIGGAGELIAEDLGNQRAVAKFQKLRALAWDALIRETTAREMANQEIVLGRNS